MKPRTLAVFAALACAGPLAAQAVPLGPRLLRVAASSGGVVLSVDSTSLARTGDSTFVVDVVYQFPADTAQQVEADRQVEHQEMDCARTRFRSRTTAFYSGETLAPISTPGPSPAALREWQAVGEDELPIFQAVCGYLLAAPFAASLPVTFELWNVDRAPEVANVPAVAHALAAEYPRDLRDAGIGGTVQLRFLITAEGQPDVATAWALSATRPEFAGAAIRVLQWMRFRPARKDGAAVPVWVSLPISFGVVPHGQGPPGRVGTYRPPTPGAPRP